MGWLTYWYLRARAELESLLAREEGQGFTEYAIIIGIVVVAAAGLLIIFRDRLSAWFQQVLADLGI